MTKKIIYLTYLSLFVFSTTHARGVFKVFIEFDKKQSQVQLSDYKVVPAGNLGKKDIPRIARMKSYARALLSGQWLALLHSGDDTKFARAIGEGKIPDIMNRLREEGLLNEVRRVSDAYGIHPLHILGPIIGENSFNGSIDSTIQDGMLSLLTESDYKQMTKKMDFVTKSKEAQKCFTLKIRNYWKWRCLLSNSRALGKPSNRGFSRWLYRKSKKGVGTFGIGQAQPYVLWGFNDIVADMAQGRSVKTYEVNDLKTAFKHTQNDKLMIAYIAAIAKQSIDTYKIVGGVDISDNPGLTTTLYNLGDIYLRAYRFKTSGRRYPSVNYMGWFTNEFADLIMSYY